MSKQAIGRFGEEIAEKYLVAKGYKLLGRNVRGSGVEADILAKDGDTLVIVEVKTKSDHRYGLPQEMVGARKQQQLRRFTHSILARYGLVAVRVDVVAVTVGNTTPHIEHVVNAVEDW